MIFWHWKSFVFRTNTTLCSATELHAMLQIIVSLNNKQQKQQRSRQSSSCCWLKLWSLRGFILPASGEFRLCFPFRLARRFALHNRAHTSPFAFSCQTFGAEQLQLQKWAAAAAVFISSMLENHWTGRWCEVLHLFPSVILKIPENLMEWAFLQKFYSCLLRFTLLCCLLWLILRGAISYFFKQTLSYFTCIMLRFNQSLQTQVTFWWKVTCNRPLQTLW